MPPETKKISRIKIVFFIKNFSLKLILFFIFPCIIVSLFKMTMLIIKLAITSLKSGFNYLELSNDCFFSKGFLSFLSCR